MSSYRLGGLFENDSADMSAGKFPLTSMGDRSGGQVCADPGVRTAISVSRNVYITFTYVQNSFFLHMYNIRVLFTHLIAF